MRKSYRLSRSSSSRRIWLILLSLVLLLALGGVWRAYRGKPPQPAKVTQPAPAQYTSVQGKYLFSGTIVLARGVETFANGNLNQPFSGLPSLGAYDAGIADLECPVTNNNVSYQTEVDSLVFNCKPTWLPYLKKYYPIINLSSNHLYDQGQTGFNETVSTLKASGFQVVGNYNPHIEPDDCKSVVLPVRLRKSNAQDVSGVLPVAFCSYNYKELFSPQPGEIESIQKWSKLMPVVAMLNEGPEYQHVASAQAVTIAHQMIDDGASFVVGNGTHWIQNSEVYKGKLIAFSLGNFIFDQLDYDGRIALNLSVTVDLNYNNNVSKWLSVGKNCQADPTQCFTMGSDQHLQKINPVFSFSAVGSYGGYLQVATKANAQQEKDIEQLADWPTTQQALASASQ